MNRKRSALITVLLSLTSLMCTSDPGPLGEMRTETSEDASDSSAPNASDASSPAQFDASVDAGSLSPSATTCSAQTSQSACLALNPSSSSLNQCMWDAVVVVDGECQVQNVSKRCMFINIQEGDGVVHASTCVDGGLSSGDTDSIWVRETNRGFELVNNHELLQNGSGPVEVGETWNSCLFNPSPLCECACRVEFPE